MLSFECYRNKPNVVTFLVYFMQLPRYRDGLCRKTSDKVLNYSQNIKLKKGFFLLKVITLFY